MTGLDIEGVFTKTSISDCLQNYAVTTCYTNSDEGAILLVGVVQKGSIGYLGFEVALERREDSQHQSCRHGQRLSSLYTVAFTCSLCK